MWGCIACGRYAFAGAAVVQAIAVAHFWLLVPETRRGDIATGFSNRFHTPAGAPVVVTAESNTARQLELVDRAAEGD